MGAHCGTYDIPGQVDKMGHVYTNKEGVDRTGCMSISVSAGMMDEPYTGSSGDITIQRSGTTAEDEIETEMYGKQPFMKMYYYLQGCESWAPEGTQLGLGARCCVLPDNGMIFQHDAEGTSSTQTDNAYVHSEGNWQGKINPGTGCQRVPCPDDDQVLGCAGGQGGGNSAPHYENLIGNMQIDNTCTVRRSSDYQLTSAAICGHVKDGELSCHTVLSFGQAKKNHETGVWWASSTCPSGYSMTDCNAYLYSTDAWNEESCQSDMGGFIWPSPTSKLKDDATYGEFIEGNTCYALGNAALVRAQANCCKVE